MSETRKIAAILVSDVVGYSRLAGADEDRILWLANRRRKEWRQNGNTDPGDGSAPSWTQVVLMAYEGRNDMPAPPEFELGAQDANKDGAAEK